MRFRLRSLDGDITLTDGRFFVGRSRECQLMIDDPLVSRRHAVLFAHGDEVVIEDLGSRNGTLVNGVRIEQPVALAEGDRVTIGSRQLSLVTGRNPREKKDTVGFPSGAYERPPATVRPPSPALEDVTRSVSIFGMLLASCERALERGDLRDAESAAANLAVSVRAEVLRGREADAHVLNELLGLYLELAERTGRVRWIDRIFEIFGAAGRVLDIETIDRIHGLVERAGFDVAGSLEGYRKRLRERAAALSEDELARLSRLGMAAG